MAKPMNPNGPGMIGPPMIGAKIISSTPAMISAVFCSGERGRLRGSRCLAAVFVKCVAIQSRIGPGASGLYCDDACQKKGACVQV
jgi:hypothetical protein